ncbi:MAG: type II secretion system F family protein [Candidatus Sericytochromatia bacterium]
MANYACTVRDARGQQVVRNIEAESLAAARAKLREQGLFPIDIKEKQGGGDALKPINDFLMRFQKVKLKEMVIFTRQFATMINSGVALLRALNIMVDQAQSEAFKRILGNVRDGVEEGRSLSECMADHPKVFSKLYVSMVAAGEIGGVLDEVLNRLAVFMEANARLIGQLKAAMTYPSVVSVIAGAIFIFLLAFVLPIFKEMFDSMNVSLPAFTQLLINMSNFVKGSWYLLIVGAIGSVYGFITFVKTPFGRSWFDNVMLKAPIFGSIIRKVAVARFTRTLGTLLRSGVPLMTALEITQDTAGNVHIAAGIAKVREAVSEGEGMTKPLEQTKLFPPMVTQMISIGEESGNVDAMLSKVADFYDEEVEQAVKALTSLLEPIMMVLIGGMVGSMIIGMYLPMFSVISAIQ